jgi:hypothetical protein
VCAIQWFIDQFGCDYWNIVVAVVFANRHHNHGTAHGCGRCILLLCLQAFPRLKRKVPYFQLKVQNRNIERDDVTSRNGIKVPAIGRPSDGATHHHWMSISFSIHHFFKVCILLLNATGTFLAHFWLIMAGHKIIVNIVVECASIEMRRTRLIRIKRRTHMGGINIYLAYNSRRVLELILFLSRESEQTSFDTTILCFPTKTHIRCASPHKKQQKRSLSQHRIDCGET